MAALLSLFLILIISICNASDKCLSFSGGGNRAAMGAYWTMRRLETDGKLSEIRCITLISGGSWGFILWLYEETPGSVYHNILNWIYANDMKNWGAKGPIETDKGSWFERWSEEIRAYIFGMTSLKGKEIPKFSYFNEEFRNRLTLRGLGSTSVFFVVESVDPQVYEVPVIEGKVVNRLGVGKGLAGFKDYCWFTSSPSRRQYFMCSKEREIHSVFTGTTAADTGIPVTGSLRAITLLDVLNYCSSAWATEKGLVNIIHRHTTKEVFIKKKKYRLIDAGGTFNDPLIPFWIFTYEDVEIWNFDFSEYSLKDKLGSLKEISNLKGALARIELETPPDFMANLETLASGPPRSKYDITIGTNKIIHCPLYGKNAKEKMITSFPTMREKKIWAVKGWSMMRMEYFQHEWGSNLIDILRAF